MDPIVGALLVVFGGLGTLVYVATRINRTAEIKGLGFTKESAWVLNKNDGRFVLDYSIGTLMWISDRPYKITLKPSGWLETPLSATGDSAFDTAYEVAPDSVESRSYLGDSLRRLLMDPPNVTIQGQRIITPAPLVAALHSGIKRLDHIHRILNLEARTEERLIEIALRDSNPEVRFRGFIGLFQRESGWDLFLATTREMIESRQFDIWIRLIEFLKVNKREDAVSLFRGWLKSENVDFRNAASVALAALGDTESHKDLWRGIEDMDELMKIMLVKACSAMGAASESHLIDILKSESSKAVKRQAVVSLKSCGTSAAIEPLLMLRRNLSYYFMQYQIDDTLSKIRSQSISVQPGLISPAPSDLDQGAISVGEDP